MAERFGADVVPFVLRGDCPACGLRRPADGDPCPQCGTAAACTRQAGCPKHGSVDECPDDEFSEVVDRARFGAALRGLADWFEANPGWPVPWAVTFSSRAVAEQIAAIRDAANLRAGTVAGGHENGQLTFWPNVPGIDYVTMMVTPPEVPQDAGGAE